MKYRIFFTLLSIFFGTSIGTSQTDLKLDSILYFELNRDTKDIYLKKFDTYFYFDNKYVDYERNSFNLVNKKLQLDQSAMYQAFHNQNKELTELKQNSYRSVFERVNNRLISHSIYSTVAGIEKLISKESNQYKSGNNIDTVITHYFSIYQPERTHMFINKIDSNIIIKKLYILKGNDYQLNQSSKEVISTQSDTISVFRDTIFSNGALSDLSHVVKIQKGSELTEFRTGSPPSKTISKFNNKGLISSKISYAIDMSNRELLRSESYYDYDDRDRVIKVKTTDLSQDRYVLWTKTAERTFYDNDEIKTEEVTLHPAKKPYDYYYNKTLYVRSEKKPTVPSNDLETFTVSPNPIHSYIFFPIELYGKEYKLYSFHGQFIESGIVDHGHYIDDLPNGNYVLIVENKKCYFTKL